MGEGHSGFWVEHLLDGSGWKESPRGSSVGGEKWSPSGNVFNEELTGSAVVHKRKRGVKGDFKVLA